MNSNLMSVDASRAGQNNQRPINALVQEERGAAHGQNPLFRPDLQLRKTPARNNEPPEPVIYYAGGSKGTKVERVVRTTTSSQSPSSGTRSVVYKCQEDSKGNRRDFRRVTSPQSIGGRKDALFTTRSISPAEYTSSRSPKDIIMWRDTGSPRDGVRPARDLSPPSSVDPTVVRTEYIPVSESGSSSHASGRPANRVLITSSRAAPTIIGPTINRRTINGQGINGSTTSGQPTSGQPTGGQTINGYRTIIQPGGIQSYTASSMSRGSSPHSRTTIRSANSPISNASQQSAGTSGSSSASHVPPGTIIRAGEVTTSRDQHTRDRITKIRDPGTRDPGIAPLSSPEYCTSPEYSISPEYSNSPEYSIRKTPNPKVITHELYRPVDERWRIPEVDAGKKVPTRQAQDIGIYRQTDASKNGSQLSPRLHVGIPSRPPDRRIDRPGDRLTDSHIETVKRDMKYDEKRYDEKRYDERRPEPTTIRYVTGRERGPVGDHNGYTAVRVVEGKRAVMIPSTAVNPNIRQPTTGQPNIRQPMPNGAQSPSSPQSAGGQPKTLEQSKAAYAGKAREPRRRSTGCGGFLAAKEKEKLTRPRVLSYDQADKVPVIDETFSALVESFVGKINLKECNTSETAGDLGYDPFDGEQPIMPPSTHILLPTSYVKRLQNLDAY